MSASQDEPVRTVDDEPVSAAEDEPVRTVDDEPVSAAEDEPVRRDADANESGDGMQPVLSKDDGDDLRRRWDELQAQFVDAPQEAVQAADRLVADVFERVTRTFAEERGRLEEQWNQGEEASTEDLRVALQRYRSFFQRLLAV
jgi:hypothetical protein